MHRLKRLRIFLVEVDAGDTAVVDLPEELTEIRAPLVPNPCFGEQTALASSLEYADGEVYVLTETHL